MFSFQEVVWILEWWGSFFLVGIVFAPLTFLIFKNFWDRGFLFSKVLGIGIISYIILVVNSLHLLPFGVFSLAIILWICLIGNIFILKKHRIDKLKPFAKIFLFEEFLFFAGIVFWSYIRAHEPSINGLEKFMDFGFVNSILRTTWQPAVDMWFPPLPINYYYFGHLVTAVMTEISFVPSSVSYNLMIATLFSFTLTLSFSLGTNILSKVVSLRKAFIGGLLTGLIVALAGNLHTIYAFFASYNTDAPVPFWNLQFLFSTFPNSYWYPNATRFIPFTIHEFPIYSFVVSDLHGHVIDIPFVLLTIALLYALLIQRHGTPRRENSSKKIEISNGSWKIENSKKYQFLISNFYYHFLISINQFLLNRTSNFEFRILLLALLLAIMYMTNAWDGLIYMALAGFVFVYIRKPKLIIPLFFLFVLFTLPFSLNFKPFAQGIGMVCPPKFLENIGQIGPLLFEKDHCQRSTWWQLLTLYGFFYFFVLSFIIFIRRQKKKFKVEVSDVFIFLLILLSSILIITPELIYLKDIYPAHYRANTMFKLVYQSFIMLSISSGYIIVRLAVSFKPKGFKVFNIYPVRRYWSNGVYYVYLLLAILFLILVFVYPYFAIKSYYGDLRKFIGLDGIAYMKDRLPDDYKAIMWLNQNIEGRPVIVEAQGDSYTDYARISANTGLPTVLGWTVHEWLWRGTYDIPAPRIEEVRLIYESNDLDETKKILKKHNIKYVYLGNLEREKYNNINEAKFEKLGDVVFEVGQTKIYKLN